MTKTFYQTDDVGRFVGAVLAELDPRETAARGVPVYARPRGAVVTPPPSVTAGNVAVWTGTAWGVTTEANLAGGGSVDDVPPMSEIEYQRSLATLSRLEMALSLKAAAILTHAEAMQLAGGTIPAPLAAFIALLPDQESREFAELATIAGQPFERASPLWSAVAAADTGPSEAEIDAIFGLGT